MPVERRVGNLKHGARVEPSAEKPIEVPDNPLCIVQDIVIVDVVHLEVWLVVFFPTCLVDRRVLRPMNFENFTIFLKI